MAQRIGEADLRAWDYMGNAVNVGHRTQASRNRCDTHTKEAEYDPRLGWAEQQASLSDDIHILQPKWRETVTPVDPHLTPEPVKISGSHATSDNA